MFLYDMKLEVEGLECVSPGPILLMSRHASIIDTILPIRVLSGALGMTLRIVKKRELLWDPCVDVISHRMPRVFVRRGSGNSGRELERVEQLLGGVNGDDVVCIFPEGTRFTPEKRRQIVSKLRREHPELAARAERLRNLLPPKPGGALALLNRQPDMDVVFCAHTGLEGAVRLQDFKSGVLLGRTVKIRYPKPTGCSSGGRNSTAGSIKTATFKGRGPRLHIEPATVPVSQSCRDNARGSFCDPPGPSRRTTRRAPRSRCPPATVPVVRIPGWWQGR
jgi:1-acyl-sn-glycerol-3-phosphate acyltransferase